MRTYAASTSPYAPIVGFSRAVRVGPYVSVGATAPMSAEGTTVGLNDPAAQAERCLETIGAALGQVGATLGHVVRTRIMLTDISHWEQVARVHGRYFADVRPASTIVEVSRFIDPDWLIEIEVDAVVDD